MSVARAADLPRSYRQVRAWISANRRQARELEAEAQRLEAMLPGLMCECGGGVIVPRDRKSGRFTIDAAYTAHTLDCPKG